jgi:hypothetical protein
MLGHLSHDRRRHLVVEAAVRPGATQQSRLACAEGREPVGAVTVQVDGRPVRFTQHPAGEDGDWVAIVHESGMEIAVTARGMTPAEVELTLGVDPEPYLAGLHHGLQRAKAKLARARR